MMATTTRLSQQQDLLEGMHADGVLGYLRRYGVLDPAVLAGLGKRATARERNSIILRHVEGQGKPALTLLVNALRQSWQLQLANSLDPDQRIRPTSVNSYFGNHRYRGEITIRIQIEALKITTQENRQQILMGDTIVCQDLTSADKEFTQKSSQLREEMTQELNKPPYLNTITSFDELDGTPLGDDNDEDFVKPKSCWCFCFVRKKKSKSKKIIAKQKAAEGYQLNKVSTPDENIVLSQNVSDKNVNSKQHRRKLKKKSKEKIDEKESIFSKGSDKIENYSLNEKYINRELTSSKSGLSEKYSVKECLNGPHNNQVEDARSVSQVDVRFVRDEAAGVKPGHGGGAGEMSRSDQVDSSLRPRNSMNHNVENFHNLLHQPYIETNTNVKIRSAGQISNKDTLDSTDYNYRADLATVKANNNNLIVPKRQSGNTYVACLDLTSADRDFQRKASELCAKIADQLHTEIIKYFEQERGILVLDVSARNNGINVVCICMARSHARSLLQDVRSGGLLGKIEDMVAKVDTAMLEIQEVKMKIVVDEDEMTTVLEELS